jgi:serine carboxypeptidase-like clade 2
MCDDYINNNYKSDPVGSYVLLPILKQAGVKILVYSGDQDAAVSIENTLASLAKLKLKETASIQSFYSIEWTPVADEETVVIGWLVKYDILDLMVVRGAGHVNIYLMNRWYLLTRER